MINTLLHDQVSAGSLVLVLVPLCGAGLLGAGRGAGSCAAPPYRVEAAALAWAQGCPPHAEVEEAKLLYMLLSPSCRSAAPSSATATAALPGPALSSATVTASATAPRCRLPSSPRSSGSARWADSPRTISCWVLLQRMKSL